MTKLFDPLSIDDNHFLLASHLPPGKFWANAFNENDDFGKFFRALAVEFYRFQVLEKKFYDELDINKTDELLSDWERSVGIPDECFTEGVGKAERRKRVYAKFSKFGGVQTKDDFVRVAAFFGFEVIVLGGTTFGIFPLTFPALFLKSGLTAKHTIYVFIQSAAVLGETFPLNFPISFGAGGVDFLQCIFDKLAPANVKVSIFNEGEI